MTAIQTNSGSQYLRKDRALVTADRKQICLQVANLIVIRIAKSGYLWHRRAPPRVITRGGIGHGAYVETGR
jgi:hypothetical protein